MKLNLEKLYKILRVLIYLIPLAVISFGVYVVLFPTEVDSFDSQHTNTSKFEIQKDPANNAISFGIFPQLPHQFINLNVDSKGTIKANCKSSIPSITLEKTYLAFLYPDGTPIETKEDLDHYLFEDNSSSYPNGSLLHFKATDQVFFLSKGQKILFPSPEIFSAFGFSFDNLTDVDQQTLDQFPDVENKAFTFSMPHPDDTIFKAFPSHKIYLIADGQKHEIASQDLLDSAWEKNFTVAASDHIIQNIQTCKPSGGKNGGPLECRFDSALFPDSLGKYYNFTMQYPSVCSVQDVHINTAEITFVSEKSIAAVKNSVKGIFASVLRRYFGK